MILLRKLRHDRALTLDDVSRGTGLTKSYISQIERGLKLPSLEALRRISEYLGISPSLLLQSGSGGLAPNRDCLVIPAEKRIRTGFFDADHNRHQSVIETLTPEQGQSGLRAYLVTADPGRSVSGRQVTHFHPEFAFVLSGRFNALIRDTVHPMAPGCSIYVAPMVPHDYLNTDEEPAQILFSFSD